MKLLNIFVLSFLIFNGANSAKSRRNPGGNELDNKGIQVNEKLSATDRFNHNAEINHLHTQLLPESSLSNNLTNSDIWRRIGILLQSKEIMLHSGGRHFVLPISF